MLLACITASGIGAATAQDYDSSPLPQWYVGPLAGVMLPDAARDTDVGPNVQFVVGAALAESLYLEANGFGGDNSMAGAGLDLTLGTPAPGNPFFMLGAGAVSHEIGGLKETTTFGNLGFGIYLPVPSATNLLWRAEFRYNLLFDGHPGLPAEDILEDGRINVGVLWKFGEADAQPVEALEEPVAAADADKDGVPDARDQCPDTPAWARPDANGCMPDSDADGIDDSKDNCPASPAGVPVDPNGCPVPETPAEPPPAPPAEKPVQKPLEDRDSDGVPDSEDACPNTAGALEVDERGCVKPESIQIRNVHFDLESARLTADGFMLLRQIAATLRAYPDMRIEISGHADASGSNKYNEKLSVRRAETVHDFLNYLGVAENRMDLKAYGETKPIADNKTDEGRAHNRRVEFRKLTP